MEMWGTMAEGELTRSSHHICQSKHPICLPQSDLTVAIGCSTFEEYDQTFDSLDELRMLLLKSLIQND